MRRWFVARVKPRKELDTAERLGRATVKTYVPMAREFERRGKWLVPFEKGVLFPGYVFVIADSRDPDWTDAIQKTRGVIRIMCDRFGRPIPIPYAEIRILRERDKTTTKKPVTSKFKVGQKVRIQAGAFEGFSAVLDGVSGRRLRVLLQIFGRETTAELAENEVAAA